MTVILVLIWMAFVLVFVCALTLSGRIAERESDAPLGIGAPTERGPELGRR